MQKYDHKKIEKKWQEQWAADELYKTAEGSGKPKAYILDMFPYPSGEGLHVGHPKGYIATDVYSRFKKMNGYEVLHPMGWDAFGLPAENFAIKHKVHPRVAVERNIENFKKQLAHLGFNYDWSREINTTDPSYYKWTQWVFLQLFKKGLAYESHEPINWCPSCQTGLANEDLESDGTCERCGSTVEKKPMRQWVLKITDYADRMLQDLDTLTQWPSHIKEAQRNWIGRSEGAEIDFNLTFTTHPEHNGWRNPEDGRPAHIRVFTTRPDTLFGATYLVLAPEHPWVRAVWDTEHNNTVENKDEVAAYVVAAQKKTEIERTTQDKEKTGVELMGIKAVNPATQEEIPVFVADYVLAHYGTGAIMAVPAHDERDYAFAQKYNLPIVPVISPITGVPQENPEYRKSIVAIVHDPKTDTYLTVRWKDRNQTLFVGGGMEDGEDPQTTAAREICEETRCTNVRYVSQTMPIRHNYFAHSKGVAREIDAIGFLFELEDDEETPQTLEENEKEQFDIEWHPATEVASLIKDELHALVWQLLVKKEPYTGTGLLINSDVYTGMQSVDAKVAITNDVGGMRTTTYKLKDWVFSRQRYWGEPIPIIHCEKCGAVPVPEEDLPVTLPEVDHYEPTGTGESPLADIESWVNVTCPSCGGAGKRETNTMPQWAGSSWYYLRFVDPHNTNALIDVRKEKDWMPVDVYVGGDHAVRHLIYARFWHKFLYDIGVVSTIEPFTRLEFLGFILAEDGRKMSKRWGNIINPDDVVLQHGADTLRVYEMFMGPFENTVAWSTNGLVGAQRFIERTWRLQSHLTETTHDAVTRELHRTIRKVSEDIEAFKFNTSIAQMMTFVNVATEHGLTEADYRTFLQLLAPFAPHMTEELWRVHFGNKDSIHASAWPTYNEELLTEETVVLAVQINGKVRGEVTVSVGATQDDVVGLITSDERFARWIPNTPQRIIFVPNKLINMVISDNVDK